MPKPSPRPCPASLSQRRDFMADVVITRASPALASAGTSDSSRTTWTLKLRGSPGTAPREVNVKLSPL